LRNSLVSSDENLKNIHANLVRTMKDFFEKVSHIFSKYQNEKHVEFEMRLGKINRGSFDTNVGQETFEKILRRLQKYQGWEHVKHSSDMAYYHEKIRLTIDEETEDQVQVSKNKLEKFDYSLSGRPFDVRFAVAKEVPNTEEVEEFAFARKRTRWSFVRKNLSIDMTIVSGDAADLDSEEENSYQIEFEIVDPQKVSDTNTLYNIVYKVNDVLDLA
jgi:hypothetical protein